MQILLVVAVRTRMAFSQIPKWPTAAFLQEFPNQHNTDFYTLIKFNKIAQLPSGCIFAELVIILPISIDSVAIIQRSFSGPITNAIGPDLLSSCCTFKTYSAKYIGENLKLIKKCQKITIHADNAFER